MKYRKKPIVIEAIQFNGNNADKIISWAHEGLPPIAATKISKSYHKHCLNIITLEGVLNAVITDFIVKGIKGEVYPVRKDIFEETYEKV